MLLLHAGTACAELRPLTLTVTPGGVSIYDVKGGRQMLASQPPSDVGTLTLRLDSDTPHTLSIERPPFDTLQFDVQWDASRQAWTRLVSGGAVVIDDSTEFALSRVVHINSFPSATVWMDAGHGQTMLDMRDGGVVLPNAWQPPPLFLQHPGFEPYKVMVPKGAFGQVDTYPADPIHLRPSYWLFSYWQFDVALLGAGLVVWRLGGFRRRPQPVELPVNTVTDPPVSKAPAPQPEPVKSVTTTFMRFLRRMSDAPTTPTPPATEEGVLEAAPPTQMLSLQAPPAPELHKAVETTVFSAADRVAVAGPNLPPRPTDTDGDKMVTSVNGRRFDLKALLGQTPHTAVYEAVLKGHRHESLAVVKLLRSPRPGLGEALRKLTGLTHPLIVPLLDWGEMDGCPFLVRDRVEGSTLGASLIEHAGHPAPLETAVGWAVDMLKALETAHRRGTCHGHLKPENVLIGPDGHLRVMDFGVAGGHADQGEPGLYQPPEQFYQNPPDQTADVYAVGGILYQLLSGHAPFRVGTPDLEARIRNGDFAPLATLAPGLPPGLVDVVRGMMATQVPQRLQTAAGARERLLGYASATSGASSSVE